MPHIGNCSIDGCKRPYRAKGLCNVHYKKWRRGEMPKKGRYKTCSEEACRQPMYRWGICETHYLQVTKKEAPAAAEAPKADAPVDEAPPQED